MYSKFLQVLASELDDNQNDGQVGIIALEMMSVSTRLTSTLPPWEDTVAHIRHILAYHNWTDFAIVAHSFGSICATHLLRSLRVSGAQTQHPLILVDPVTLSIHFAEIPYNFIYRQPRTVSELLCSFAATDIGICPAIMRRFDWTQNVLWLEEISQIQVDVVLAGKDVIVDTRKLRSYLLKNGFDNAGCQVKNDSGIDLDVMPALQKANQHHIHFHEHYDHGEIFLRSLGRIELASLVLKRCGNSQG